METYSPIRGMNICQNDTGDYVKKSDFDAMKKRAERAETLYEASQNALRETMSALRHAKK